MKYLKRYVLMTTGFIMIVIIVIVSWKILNPLKDWGITKDLGNNYVFTSEKSILYRDDKGKEYFVIPFGVTNLSFDNGWIIAETQGLNAIFRGVSIESKNGCQYWIIDKESSVALNSQWPNNMIINNEPYPIVTSGLIGPLDSISFVEYLKENNILLSFIE